MNIKSSFYGFIRTNTSNGVIVWFYGSVIELLYGYNISVGSCVYVGVLTPLSVHVLTLLTSMRFDYTLPLEYTSKINSSVHSHKIGEMITLDIPLYESIGNRLEYLLDN